MDSYTSLNFLILMESFITFFEKKHKRFKISSVILLLLFIVSIIISTDEVTGICLVITGIFRLSNTYFMNKSDEWDGLSWVKVIFDGYLMGIVYIFSGILPILGFFL